MENATVTKLCMCPECGGVSLLCPHGTTTLPLYTAPPVPRDVLMAALTEINSRYMEVCGAQFGGEYISAIADRYASQVQPEPVNQQMLAALNGLTEDIQCLIGESAGVYGLHLNGDLSPWGELEAGGRFERLTHLPDAHAAIAAAEEAQPVVYPIERVLTDADHLAHCVDAILLALNKYHGAKARAEVEETAANVLELEHCEAAVSECWRAAHTATYEYRKRAQRYRDSAATQQPASAQPVAVPDGWRFCSADFSLQAAGKSKTGSVLLVRDPDGCAEWHKLSDDIKEIVPLYLSGKGNTVDEAIADAVSHRVFLSAAQEPEGGE